MSFADIIEQDRIEEAIRQEGLKEAVVPQLRDFLDSLNDLPSGRAKGYHASQMYYMCSRQEILRQLYPEKASKERTLPNTQVIFDVGHAMHWWFQNQYYGPMGVLKGKWRCTMCHDVHEGFMPSKSHKCKEGVSELVITSGNNHFWRFEEMFFFNEEWQLCGSTDGIIVVHKGTGLEDDIILEMKTANAYSFKSADGESPAHKMQANLYMWGFKYKKAVLQYIDKGGSTKLFPVKEFVVEYDETIVEQALDKIRAVRNGAAKKELPDKCDMCAANSDCWLAKQCAWKDECFGVQKRVMDRWAEPEVTVEAM